MHLCNIAILYYITAVEWPCCGVVAVGVATFGCEPDDGTRLAGLP